MLEISTACVQLPSVYSRGTRTSRADIPPCRSASRICIPTVADRIMIKIVFKPIPPPVLIFYAIVQGKVVKYKKMIEGRARLGYNVKDEKKARVNTDELCKKSAAKPASYPL